MAHQTPSTRKLTGLAGLAAAVLFGAANALWAFDQPHAGAPPGKIVAFYEDGSGRIVAGASISLAAIAIFVLFGAGARALLREHDEGGLLADTAFGGVLVMVMAGIGAETINMVGALRAGDGQLTKGFGQALFEISYVLGYNAAGVGIGIVLLAVAAASLRTPALYPRWLALLLVVAGLAFLTPLSRFLLAPGVLLLAVGSAQLLRTGRRGTT